MLSFNLFNIRGDKFISKFAAVIFIAAVVLLTSFDSSNLYAQSETKKTSTKKPVVEDVKVKKKDDDKKGSGIIVGKVVDKNTGDMLIGANVYLKGTYYGAAADLEGNYRIVQVPSGSYTLIAAFIGYSTYEIEGVFVPENETVKLDIAMDMEAIIGEEIVVEARMVMDSQAALLAQRQKADALSDAISAEEISNSGDSDAAGVVENVVGASVVDGKYVYIRGLGERYSTTQLNGASLPSIDPNKKTVQLDLFPANFLENIVTTKSFTPDKPGNFTGGSVNIGTKSFPEALMINVSSSTSYNTNSSFEDNFLTYDGGKDWLGFDDGSRAIPKELANGTVSIPSIGSSYTNVEDAQKLDMMTRAFNNQWAPTTKSSAMDQSHNISLGNNVGFLGRPLGFMGSINYGRSTSNYANGTTARWQLTGATDKTDVLTNDYNLTDSKSTEEVKLGGLFNASYQVDPNHMLGVNYMFNRVGESSARYMVGPFPRDMSTNQRYETRVLQYVEREIGSYQLRGKHFFKDFFEMKMDWVSSFSKSQQDEPDLRFFTNDYTTINRQGQELTLYSISPSIYPEPTRYFRNLEETNWDSKIDFSIPYSQWDGLSASFKFGMAYSEIDHNFRERYFQFRQDALEYDGDPHNFFNDDKVGILDHQSTDKFFRFGNYVLDMTSPRNNYDGRQEIGAAYIMTKLPVTRKFTVIGGVRYETTKINVASHDELLNEGNLDNGDILPSVNFVYSLSDNVNIRSAYGRTLARPTFRELAPFPSFEFVNDYIFSGNPDLKRTMSNNYDLRWEWFPRIGEIVSASVFYKNLSNPIEKVIMSINGQTRFQNVDEATVYGFELEGRKQLDFIAPFLTNFNVGANFSYIRSTVDIAESELIIMRAFDPNTRTTRELQGQSPYVLNADIGYYNQKTGTNVGLNYNVFGKRIAEVSMGGTPDVYEKPLHMLNLTFSQKVWNNISLKFSAKNLLDSDVEFTHNYKGTDFVQRYYSLGRTYKLGWSYNY